MVAIKIIGIFAIVLVGFLACKVGWLPVKSSAYLSKIVLFIASPCVLFLAIARQEYSAETIHTMLLLMAVALVLYPLSYAIGFLFCRIFRVPRADSGLYVNFCATPNNGFLGIPVALAVFGQPILFMTAILNMIQAFFLYSYGAYLLRVRSGIIPSAGGSTDSGKSERERAGSGDGSGPSADTAAPAAPGIRAGVKQLLRDFFCAPVIACLAGVVFFLLKIPVPGAVADVLEMVGATMTPLCMIFIGIQLTESNPRALFANHKLIAVSVFRLALIPALFFVMLLPLYLGGLPIRVGKLFMCAIAINFMTPIGAAVPPLAEIYGGDVKLASEGVFLSTLISMFTIPVISSFLSAM
jgi:predicted permease